MKRKRRNAVQLNMFSLPQSLDPHANGCSSEDSHPQVTDVVTQVDLVKKKRNSFPRPNKALQDETTQGHISTVARESLRSIISELSGDDPHIAMENVWSFVALPRTPGGSKGRVRTNSGQYAHLVAEAIDGKEAIGVLVYETTKERVLRRKASFELEAPRIKRKSHPGKVRTKSGHNAFLIMSGEDDSERVSVLEYSTGERVIRREDSYFVKSRMYDDEKPLQFKAPVTASIYRSASEYSNSSNSNSNCSDGIGPFTGEGAEQFPHIEHGTSPAQNRKNVHSLQDRRDTSTNDGFTEECFEKELPPLPDDTVDTQIIDDDFEPSSIILCRQESDNDSDSDSDLISLDSKFSKRLKTLRQAYEAQAQRYYYDKMGAHREEDFLELEHQAYSFSQDYVNRPDVINKLRQICVKDPDCDIELLFFEFEDVSSNALQSSEEVFQKREHSISCRTPETIASPSGRHTSIEKTDSDLRKKSSVGDLSDSESSIFEKSEKAEESDDRLGWLGDEEAAELFGLPISIIKRTSRSFWKRQSNLVNPQQDFGPLIDAAYCPTTST